MGSYKLEGGMVVPGFFLLEILETRIFFKTMDVELELSKNIEILRRTLSTLQQIEEKMSFSEITQRAIFDARFNKHFSECVRIQDVAKNAYLKILKVLHSVTQPYNSLAELALSAVCSYQILVEVESLPVTLYVQLMSWPREIATRRKAMLLETVLMTSEIPDLLE